MRKWEFSEDFSKGFFFQSTERKGAESQLSKPYLPAPLQRPKIRAQKNFKKIEKKEDSKFSPFGLCSRQLMKPKLANRIKRRENWNAVWFTSLLTGRRETEQRRVEDSPTNQPFQVHKKFGPYKYVWYSPKFQGCVLSFPGLLKFFLGYLGEKKP